MNTGATISTGPDNLKAIPQEAAFIQAKVKRGEM